MGGIGGRRVARARLTRRDTPLDPTIPERGPAHSVPLDREVFYGDRTGTGRLWWGTVDGSSRRDSDRQCQLFGTRPISGDFGSGRERHRYGLL